MVNVIDNLDEIESDLTKSIWISEVRDYELDFQGILNNACYFQYMDHARALHFSKIGIDVVKACEDEIKAVLIESKTKFLKSLKYKNNFKVTTELLRISRFKLLFLQNIIETQSGDICVTSQNTCCVLSKENKPFLPTVLNNLKISELI